MKKKCTVCKRDKKLDEFNKNKSKKDGLNNICKLCSRERSRKYYEENSGIHKANVKRRNNEERIKIAKLIHDVKEYVGCYFCDETEHICLDFHHEDVNEKKFGIAHGGSYGYKQTMEEMKKCVLMCSNCHRKVHVGILEI